MTITVAVDELTTRSRWSLDDRDEFGSTIRPGVLERDQCGLALDEDLIRLAHMPGMASRLGY